MTYSGATTFNAPSGRYGNAGGTTYSARTNTYSATGVIPINTIIATYDCNAYRSVSIQCTSMGTTGVVTPEWSNDNTTWIAATVFTASGGSQTTISAAGLLIVPTAARYLRLRMSTATTAGTTSFVTLLLDDDHSVWLATQAVALNAGTNAIGDVGFQYRANNTGAASFVSVLSPATPAAATIKAAAGRLVGYNLHNSAASLRSVKIFNVAAPTLGTTAASFEIDIPAGGQVFMNFPGGLGFSTAMTYIVTSAKGLTDNTSTGLAANDVSGFFAFA